MGAKSDIEWTDATWTPVSGCSKVSPGCAHCYAETLSLRFGHSTLPWTPANAAENVILHRERLALPLHWKKPRRIFVNSMSDLFHERVPEGFIGDVFTIMASTPQHTYQILTKRPERMRNILSHLWPFLRAHQYPFLGTRNWRFDIGTLWPLPNVWLGVSVENQHWAAKRIPLLLETPAAVRFVSCEPLLSPVDLVPWLYSNSPEEAKLGWVICGGESGQHMAKPQYKHRWMKKEWAQDIVDQCRAADVPVFFKQGSGVRPGLDEDWLGEKIQEMPRLAFQMWCS